MLDILWIIPTLPFLGFLILALFGARMNRTVASIVGVGSVSLAALITIIIAIGFMASPPEGYAYQLTLWTWFDVGGFNPGIAFHLDAMTIVFMFVITFVGSLIHLYSVEYMEHEEGFARFFAYMNLFVGAMLTLVMADNLLLMYLGWEGVGLCSFLLIGFWYKDNENGKAARKAFIVTRVGDTAMAIGLFILFLTFGTLNIQEILRLAPFEWTINSTMAITVALLLLGGAVGKSAQLPLQTWLPDAMAGPSPVSALIHAATMVTAGVYLIARTHVLFELAPTAQMVVAIVGAATLLIAGFSALTQFDIKRVLAYSTISQIGYMFLALGVGAWSAAVFHFMIHAFFKALLFLGAGALINALHHEQNMFKMGGVKDKLPVIFWTFVAGSAALASLPLITAGFYSKDLILWYAWAGDNGSFWLWLAGWFGALLTAVYTGRMVFISFYGEQKTEITHPPKMLMKIPLIVLAVLSIFGGFIELPHTLGHLPLFSGFTETALPATEVSHSGISTEIILQIIAGLTALGGIYLAYIFYLKKPESTRKFRESGIYKFWLSGWGFDKLYDTVIVRPVVWMAEVNKRDFIDQIYTFIAWLNGSAHYALTYSQTGKLRWYAMGIAAGAVITLTIAVLS